MKNKIIIGIIIALNLFIIGYYVSLQHDNRMLMYYTIGFRGVVVGKFNPREELPPIFAKLRIKNDTLISMYHPSNIILEYVEVGDSIIKFERSYKCIVKKSNGVIEHFPLERGEIDFLSE